MLKKNIKRMITPHDRSYVSKLVKNYFIVCLPWNLQCNSHHPPIHSAKRKKCKNFEPILRAFTRTILKILAFNSLKIILSIISSHFKIHLASIFFYHFI